MTKINTIDELEALYYGYNRNLLRKADAPATTSTAGVFNAIYGACLLYTSPSPRD